MSEKWMQKARASMKRRGTEGRFGREAAKRGLSTAAFARQVLANREHYSPALVKEANFARNAMKSAKG